jgi:hypothetical protein
MRREELYLADLIETARAVRGYLDGVTRERWDAEDILRDAVLYRMLLLGEIAYEPGPIPDPGSASLLDAGCRTLRPLIRWPSLVSRTGSRCRRGR